MSNVIIIALCVLSNFLRNSLPDFCSVIRRSFSFQNNSKDLDPSCKMDLDLWDCLERVKLVI